MPSISIPCPACSAVLKVPDASFIGRKARCPKCSHRFVLTLPQQDGDAVPLVLDDIPVLPLAPQKGTSARWVPDEASAAVPGPGVPGYPVPAISSPQQADFDFSSLAAPGSSGAPQFQLAETPAAGATSPPNRSKAPVRRRKKNSAGMIAMLIMALVVSGGGVAAWYYSRHSGGETVTQAPPEVNEKWEEQKLEMSASNVAAEQLSPTTGKPIPLDYLPFTPHVLCHLRPAELWKKDRSLRELQALLGDLGLWLKGQITTLSRFEPEEIEELTFAINYGPRMSEPDVAAVVRLREEQTSTDLMKRFNGRLRPDPGVEVYESGALSFLLVDRRTFAVAPTRLAGELALSKDDPALASPDMEPLLQESDRARHLTLIFDLRLIDSHREDIFIPQLQPLANQFVIWMGEDVETVSWSLHAEPDLFLETLLHQSTGSTPLKVQRHTQMQLDRLPELILSAVQKMQPSTGGSRQMIGRLPAMLQALNLGTTTHVAPNCARLVTILPQKAAANLAAASLLTWNQSLTTKFDDDQTLTKADDMVIPDRIADRLKLKVIVDFRRTPLQEAFQFIGDSIRTEVVIDGDGLKAAGFTQNMPQSFDLGSVTAQEALHAIISKYAAERDPLVLIVDEAGRKLMLNTKSKAEADGLQIFDTAAK